MVPVGEGMGETKGERAGELYWPATSTRLGRAGLCIGGGGPRSSRRDVNATLISVDGNRMIHLERERERERETATHRERERETDRQTDRDTETEREREREREKEREHKSLYILLKLHQLAHIYTVTSHFVQYSDTRSRLVDGSNVLKGSCKSRGIHSHSPENNCIV